MTATGSSKKIAKNLAAKMMLDKLEEVGSRFQRNSNLILILTKGGRSE